MEENNQNSLPEAQQQKSLFDPTAREYLLVTSKWVNFLSIMSIIGIVFMVLIAMILLFGGLIQSEYLVPTTLMSLFYMALAGVMVIPVIYMRRFVFNVKWGLETNNNQMLVDALGNNKSLFKFYGIYTIVCLALCIIMIPVTIVIGLTTSM